MPAASARTTDNVNEQTAEGNNNSSTDATKVALTVTKVRQKNNRFKDSENVNSPSPVLRAHAEKGVLLDVPGHKLAGSGAGLDEDSSSEESDITVTTRKIITPLPVGSYADSELDVIIRGPVASRLTMDDVLEDDEEELAESVVLEQDNEEPVDFRRQSRRLNAAAPSSGEEDEDDDDNNISDAGSVNEKAQSAMGVSVSGSRRLSMRSVTEPLQAIDACQTMDIDHVGDKAVDEAMASDRAMFGIVAPANGGEDIIDGVVDPAQAERSTPIPLAPTPAKKPYSKVTSTDAERRRTPAGEEDPIQPAEDFPPTPAQPNKGNSSAIVRTKTRAGKTSVKLSQLDPPFGLSPQVQSQTVETDGEKPADRQAVDAVASTRKTRSSSRLAAVTAAPLSPKRRGLDKTREQRAQEKTTKLAAKEERERLKREKALAKTGGKKNPKGASSKVSSQPVNIVEVAPPSREPSVEFPRAALLHSRTPMSQDEWTVLSPNVPDEEVRDELQSSSPATEATVAPLFFPSESQVPIPYSQRKEEGSGPDSQKDTENDDSEEEIVALMKPSHRRANASSVSFRRLTDIASQPSMFSTPSLRAAEFPSSTFPRAKDKRNEFSVAYPQIATCR
ncbi:hypothetical protein GGX14DRAFT_438837 [Mycena pura]|uniref:Uncharacterized protein n=1 Tax=Mycena pura TaxID=153505 RepID=A0AAD6VR56_9AGAR|nr:hypothetical protein GGX14DRAFT_438837 [Mycena pura]